MKLPRVLFVDDEPAVLLGVSRALRTRFEVITALSGEEGLQRLAGHDIEVVVSDMRMPLMDGATFLARCRDLVPDTVRVVMSGQSDLEASVRAINDGSIFRFLIKPVGRELLTEIVEAALEQRRLKLAERELLERTLTGAVDALTEGLAMTCPLAFGRSRRLRQLAGRLADELKLPQKWPLEVAAMLSQLGAATLPPETLRRWYADAPLSEAERLMVSRVNTLGCHQLRHIPRLEEVVSLVEALGHDWVDAASPLPARLLVVANAIERRLARHLTLDAALAELTKSGHYDEVVLQACRTLGGLLTGEEGRERTVAVTAVQRGMVLAEDVVSRTGALLISRGHTLTDPLLTCLRNAAATVGVKEPVRVWVSREAGELAA